MKKLFLIASVFFVAGRAEATKFLYGNNIRIVEPVYEDVYIAGGSVVINAPIYGDLIMAGGRVYLNDYVKNDVLVAGGEIFINGNVGDDVRSAGGRITIQKDVSGDLVMTGGAVIVEKPVTVNGTLLCSGGEVVVDGIINGDIKTAAGTFTLNGVAAGALETRSSTVNINGEARGPAVLAANTLALGKAASFAGNVRYFTGRGAMNFGNTLKGVTATYDPALRMQTAKWYFLGSATFLGLIMYLVVTFLIIMALQYLFGKKFSEASNIVFTSTAKSLGAGALFFIAVPIAIFITFLTVIAIPVSLILLLLYIMLIMLAVSITAVVAANWLNNRTAQQWSYFKLVAASFAMFVLIKLISLTPFLGAPLAILLVCLAFGSILLTIKWKPRNLAGQQKLKTAA